MAQNIGGGSSAVVDLSDDVLVITGSSVSLMEPSEKIWFTHCVELGVLSSTDLVEWRKVVTSYKALFGFLTSVKPLLGIWVQENPEVGNVVYVMPGFASVVGCRVIPQKLGPLGIEGSHIRWAPVFEVISDDNGAPTFVLHGTKNGQDFIYPGSVNSIEDTCNVLSLEVELKEKHISHPDEETDKKVPFSKLSFDDREKLLEILAGGVGIQVPEPACVSLFPCLRGDEDRFRKDVAHLSERRAMLIKMHNLGGGSINWNASHEQQFHPDQTDLNENKDPDFAENQSESKVAEVGDFLSSGDTIGLTLHASTMWLDFYETWPHTYDKMLAMYKLPIQEPILSGGSRIRTSEERKYKIFGCGDGIVTIIKNHVRPLPTVDQEYAGLWGATLGWPPYHKPENGLFILNLSYREERGKRKLVATKILDGSGYASRPNGSTMFAVNVNKPSTEPFPWSSGADSLPIGVKKAFTGEGIADGYGFRYPGSKPGSFFVLEDGMLVLIWNEPRSVLTLQRINLEELLKKGQKVPPLPPISNFKYLKRSYINVFVDSK